MNDLIDFLRARIAEDERVARAATPGPWWYNPGKQWLGPEAFEKYDLRQGEEFVGYGGPHPFTGAVAATGPANNPQSMADAAYIARHDPERVLREVEAKRQILEAHGGDLGPQVMFCPHCEHDTPCPTVRLLAAVYADHPDYRPEWAPAA